jgi:rod shape-determining protein MreC
VLSILLMIFDKRGAAVSQIRNMVSITLVPLQYAVSTPIHWVNRIGKAISTQDALLKENIDLKAQQLLLKAQVQRLLAIETENNQLKALISSSSQIQGRILIAQLLSVDSDPLVHQVILDKGTHDGVYIGQPVLDADGVMGKVIHVGPFSSRVLLINDPHSGVPVQVARNGMRAIAMGDGFSGKLKLVNVTQTADIREGDILVTSGLGDHYPEGYPLGKVSSVIKDPGLQFATILIEPNARLDRAREVLLVWPDQVMQNNKPVVPEKSNDHAKS